MLEPMSGPKEREVMPLDFLAIGRRFKLSTHQTQRLWERLIEDPRYRLALNPGRWLRAEFRREAAAMLTVAPVERSKAEPDLPWLGGGGYFATDVGKQTLVELELQRRGGYLATKVGKQTLVEVELQRRGGYPVTEVGKQTLVEFERRRSSTGVDQRRLVEELLGRGAPQAPVAEEPTVEEPTVDEQAVAEPKVDEPAVAEEPSMPAAPVASELPFRSELADRDEQPTADNARLPDEIRGDLESATGQSLSHITVHAGDHGDAVAASHGARAVARNSEIYVAKGQLDVRSDDGRELLAHEVAHTLQADAQPDPMAQPHSPHAVIETAEAEADDFAARFRRGGAATRFTPKVAVSDVAMLAPAHGAAPRQPAKSQPDSRPDALDLYLRIHSVGLTQKIREQLTETVWPNIGPDTPFTPRGDRMFSEIVHIHFPPSYSTVAPRSKICCFRAVCGTTSPNGSATPLATSLHGSRSNSTRSSRSSSRTRSGAPSWNASVRATSRRWNSTPSRRAQRI